MLLLAMVSAVTCAVAAPSARRPRKTGDTVITSNRMEYDYTDSAVLFEENVKVVDPEFTMTADRVGRVYGLDVQIHRLGASDRPIVLPLRD